MASVLHRAFSPCVCVREREMHLKFVAMCARRACSPFHLSHLFVSLTAKMQIIHLSLNGCHQCNHPRLNFLSLHTCCDLGWMWARQWGRIVVNCLILLLAMAMAVVMNALMCVPWPIRNHSAVSVDRWNIQNIPFVWHTAAPYDVRNLRPVKRCRQSCVCVCEFEFTKQNAHSMHIYRTTISKSEIDSMYLYVIR